MSSDFIDFMEEVRNLDPSIVEEFESEYEEAGTLWVPTSTFTSTSGSAHLLPNEMMNQCNRCQALVLQSAMTHHSLWHRHHSFVIWYLGSMLRALAGTP